MEASVGEKDKMEGRLLSVVSGLVCRGHSCFISIHLHLEKHVLLRPCALCGC